MVEEEIITRGGVYLAKMDPTKGADIGKIRPVVVLNAESILDISPSLLFVCPLSSQSHKTFRSLHLELPPRDNLHVISYALVEHARSIAIRRILYPRLAQLTQNELTLILHKLKRLLDM